MLILCITSWSVWLLLQFVTTGETFSILKESSKITIKLSTYHSYRYILESAVFLTGIITGLSFVLSFKFVIPIGVVFSLFLMKDGYEVFFGKQRLDDILIKGGQELTVRNKTFKKEEIKQIQVEVDNFPYGQNTTIYVLSIILKSEESHIVYDTFSEKNSHLILTTISDELGVSTEYIPVKGLFEKP